MSDTTMPASGMRVLVADFVALTKPRIISLLLVTTIVYKNSYKNSLLYLALLFAAMVVDKVLV